MAIKTKLSIDGEAEYKRQLQNITTTAKSLDAQMKAVTSTLEENLSAEQKAEKQTELLTQKQTAQQKAVDLYRQQLDQANAKLQEYADKLTEATQNGNENDDAVRKAQKDYEQYQAEVSKLQTNLANAETELNNTSRALNEVGNESEESEKKASVFSETLKSKLTGEAIIAGVKALGNAIKELGSALKDVVLDSAAFADDILTLSSTTGLSTDKLQEYKYMAELTDVSLETITGSQTKLIKTMQTASKGTGDASKAFAELGVSVTNADGTLRNQDVVFNQVIDALGRMDNETQRDAYAMQIFGKSARELNPLIEQGSAGIAEFAQEAHDMGYVLDEEQLGSLGAVDDAYQRFQKTIEGLKNQLGVALAPVITDLAGRFQEWLNTVDLDAIAQKIADVASKIGEVVSWVVNNFDTVVALVIGLSTAVGVLNAIMLANPIGIIIALVAGLTAAIIAIIANFDSLKATVSNVWNNIKITISNVINNIVAGFKDLINTALSWGRDLIQNFINGIVAKAQALMNTVRNIAQGVRDFLGFSEPKKGPLSNFHTYAPDMMKLYADGIKKNAYRVEDAIANATGNMAVAVNGANAGTSAVNYGGFNIVVNGSEGQSARDIANEVMYLIQSRVNRKEAVFG